MFSCFLMKGPCEVWREQVLMMKPGSLHWIWGSHWSLQLYHKRRHDRLLAASRKLFPHVHTTGYSVEPVYMGTEV
ncbi:mCG140362, isoform CRA_b [Mus musculus]|nr:mCG140362, isoform CRA_b [Mus musculus]